MSLGNRIREARERAKLSQEQMAELVNVGRTTISVWENDKKTPGGKNLDRLAAVLGVSTDFLMGRDDAIKNGLPLQAQREPEESTYIADEHFGVNTILRLPVYDDLQSACAGRGFDTGECESMPTEFKDVPSWVISRPISFEPGKTPFIVTIYGDSMAEANLPNGIQVIVNPMSEIHNGDVAVVKLNGERMIKWLYWNNNGGGELRSSSTRYPPRYFTREEIESGYFEIIGKVCMGLCPPLRGA